jgi:Carboxypeptidase regulatory-like domain
MIVLKSAEVFKSVGNRMAKASLLHLAFYLLLFSGITQAQGPLKMFANSYTGTPPDGPAQTQTIQLLTDPAPGSPPSTIVNVTATLSNQQYAGVGTGPGNPVVLFGGRLAVGTTTINTTPIFDAMDSIAFPADNMFSNASNGSPTGISVVDNHAFSIYSSVQHWQGLGVPATNSRVYVADLTLNFSSPVSNPYLHVVGMGGFIGQLGFSNELNLTTPGLTISKVQGNTTLVVSGNEINNGNATLISTNCENGTAACGTVRVAGTNITTITFQLFLRGDGGTPTWSAADVNAGDFWMMGVSLPASAPTAADAVLGGRVTAANGRGVSGARLNLTSGSGQTLTAITNGFGYYRFAGIQAGQTVQIGISSKRHRFPVSQQVVFLVDNAFDVNFVAEN